MSCQHLPHMDQTIVRLNLAGKFFIFGRPWWPMGDGMTLLCHNFLEGYWNHFVKVPACASQISSQIQPTKFRWSFVCCLYNEGKDPTYFIKMMQKSLKEHKKLQKGDLSTKSNIWSRIWHPTSKFHCIDVFTHCSQFCRFRKCHDHFST